MKRLITNTLMALFTIALIQSAYAQTPEQCQQKANEKLQALIELDKARAEGAPQAEIDALSARYRQLKQEWSNVYHDYCPVTTLQ